MLPLTEIRIRDPYVLPVHEENSYYLYGTTDQNVWAGEPEGFDCYRSADLQSWEGPIPAFRPPPGFWADRQFWAPEVHTWAGRYFMFATFAGPGDLRGTQVLVSDSPAGPFAEWSAGPLTPAGWQCLDGTLHVDADGSPWMVFCHEWLQIGDGAIYAQPLALDLKTVSGPPCLLFRASEATWTAPVEPGDPPSYVTDGPWVVREEDELVMLWSSHTAAGYAVGIARSTSGTLLGPWQHDPEPLWDADGGHAMTFTDQAGQQRLSLHRPNSTPHERAEFHPVSLGSRATRVGTSVAGR